MKRELTILFILLLFITGAKASGGPRLSGTFDYWDSNATGVTVKAGYAHNLGPGVDAGIVFRKSVIGFSGELFYSFDLTKRLDISPGMSAQYLDSLDFGPGVRLNFGLYRGLGLSVGGKHFFNGKSAIFYGGLTFQPLFKDSDGDWVENRLDRCPTSPHRASVGKDGCARDTDGDGVFDGLDRCPETPFMAFVDSLGCPSDLDKDGVYDGVDKCPDTPPNITVDSLGCPRDIDNDGVPDYEDICPSTPANAWVDATGCPSDSDEDGVLDGIDRCEGTPTGFEVDRFGCPYIMPVDTLVITDLFDSELNLRGTAVAQIENVSKRIRAYPDRRVLLSVYTDSEGSPQYNYNRSSIVLGKVTEILLKRGIEREQFEIKPMGESAPISNNSTADGRKINRRLEVKYLE